MKILGNAVFVIFRESPTQHTAFTYQQPKRWTGLANQQWWKNFKHMYQLPSKTMGFLHLEWTVQKKHSGVENAPLACLHVILQIAMQVVKYAGSCCMCGHLDREYHKHIIDISLWGMLGSRPIHLQRQITWILICIFLQVLMDMHIWRGMLIHPVNKRQSKHVESVV